MKLAASRRPSVIPAPAEWTPATGHFVWNRLTSIVSDDSGAAGAVRLLQSRRPEAVTPATFRGEQGRIVFRRSRQSMVTEAYVLQISPGEIVIEAAGEAGWFYGAQTLLQLAPPTEAGCIAAMRIVDRPRFQWRGLMLDVSRHMMPVDDIRRLLDNMAACKLNTLHWHLTDDQGWRIESKRFPKLNEISSYRRGADGRLTPSGATAELPHIGKYGGFYTHDDIRAIVAYAAKLHINVVPEIEMPGHAMAVLAAYPELACNPGPFETGVRMGVYDDVYCAGNDATLEFLEQVMGEILPLFPSQFVHVGGDECRKSRWKQCPKCQARITAEKLGDEHGLQSFVIRRMADFLAARGRRLIGWDEILEGGLAPGATVMSWRGTEGGIAAARAGHDVVMTPHTHCYLDYRQAADGEPPAIGDLVTPLKKVYDYEPLPAELTPAQARHIIGIQGNVWTEYMHDTGHVEYMIWPRAAAIAETGWSEPCNKDFDDFVRRSDAFESMVRASGSNYRSEPIESFRPQLQEVPLAV